MYIYITHIYINIHIICAHTYIYIYICTFMYLHQHMHTHTFFHTYINIIFVDYTSQNLYFYCIPMICLLYSSEYTHIIIGVTSQWKFPDPEIEVQYAVKSILRSPLS